MKQARNLIFYIVIIVIFSGLVYFIIQSGGKSLENGIDVTTGHVADKNQWNLFIESFMANFTHPLAILLLQIVTIIIVARFFGWICRKIGQPTVIGEIVAGIVLGPSLLGMLFPEFSGFLLPEHSLDNLQFLSQIGLILFMFVVGMELDLRVLRNQAHEAVVISHASIVFPFTLGVGLAWFLYASFAPEGVRFSSFALFLGISMSITAFPVLARIVQERGIHKSHLGSIVITCAAADDITAWSLLAAVIAIVRAGTFVSALPTMVLAVGYVIVMLKIVKPFLKRVGELHTSQENLSKPIVAIFFLVLLFSSYLTEVIGIHALFGAFMAGVIMPDNQKFKRIFIEKVEDVALILLLPLFFVYTGLRTQIGLLNDIDLWKVCGLVILVAIIGKFAGSALAARFVGQSWKDSLSIGALMNTRGLVELVALNIGYDLGVLTPEMFAMLVIMALVTTFMTAPALHWIDKIFTRKKIASLKKETGSFRILISFGKPEMGATLLRLANALVNNKGGKPPVTALHLSPNRLLGGYGVEDYEKESFVFLNQEAGKLGQQVTPLFKISENIETDIADIANKGEYDLLLVGTGHSIYAGSFLGNLLGYSTNFLNPEYLLGKVSGKEKFFGAPPFAESTRQILMKSKIPVGILVDNKLVKTENVLLAVFDNADGFLMEYVNRLLDKTSTRVTIVDTEGIVSATSSINKYMNKLGREKSDRITFDKKNVYSRELLEFHDLMLISLDSWRKLVDSRPRWLKHTPSTLIIRN